MPETGVPLLPSSHYMNTEEVLQLAGIFTDLGVRKIRLTGGEPLVRKDFTQIAHGLAKLDASLSLTSNAVIIDRHLDLLEETGFSHLNISLDTLQRDRFFYITKRDNFGQVMDNIERLFKRDFELKINVVLMKSFNESEIPDFIEWSQHIPAEVRFIEFMPFNGNHWAWDSIFPYEEVLRIARERFDIEKVQDEANATAKSWRVKGGIGKFGVIASMTNPFCDTCNRIRLTSDGKIRNCLFSESEIDLLSPLRRGEDVKSLIIQSIEAKHEKHGGHAAMADLEESDFQGRSMIRIGG